MKKNILLFVMSLLSFIATDALAQEWYDEDPCCDVREKNFYAKILSGANFLQNTTINQNRSTFQTGYVVAGFLGYSWDPGLCLEAEYAFRRNTISKIHFFGQGFSQHGYFRASSYMVNLLWNLPLSSWSCAFWNIQPFVGVGIGYDFQRMHSSNSSIVFNQKWSHFSWQLMTGLAYPFFCNTEVALEYKFHKAGSHFYNHSIGVGFVYKFDFIR